MMMVNSKRQGGSGATGGAAPVPPQRHSSIRPNAPSTPPTHMANASHQFGSSSGLSSGSGSASVGRLVTDLETKFGKRFHNVTEFPKPPPFLNIQKVYPSRTFKATNAPSSGVNNNNNNSSVASNNNTTTSNPGGGATSSPAAAPPPPPVLKPAYAPLKKHRAPAPPPQAGVAAATVSVIRQSSFLYGGAGAGGGAASGAAGTSIRPQSQPAGIGPRNSTVY